MLTRRIFSSGKMTVHAADHYNTPFSHLPQHFWSTAKPTNTFSGIATEPHHIHISVRLRCRTTYLHQFFASKVPPMGWFNVASMFNFHLEALSLVKATRWCHYFLIQWFCLHKDITLVKQTDVKSHTFQYSQHQIFSYGKCFNKLKATVWDRQPFSNEAWGLPWYF